MPVIDIDGLVLFAPNIGVLVQEKALDVSPEELSSTLRVAFSHINDELLLEACCGGRGPLNEDYRWRIPFDEYLAAKRRSEIIKATVVAKQKHTGIRRAHFGSQRSQLSLALIEAGVSHVCAHTDCGDTDDLTIDHVVPLSRGGTDDLSNLRFLCRIHNSRKRDRLPDSDPEL